MPPRDGVELLVVILLYGYLLKGLAIVYELERLRGLEVLVRSPILHIWQLLERVVLPLSASEDCARVKNLLLVGACSFEDVLELLRVVVSQ